MTGIRMITGRLAILTLSWLKEGDPEGCLYEASYRGSHLELQVCAPYFSFNSLKKRKTNQPVLLIICGYGVIRKEFSKNEQSAAERIITDQEFLWDKRRTSSGEQIIAFTRRDRLTNLLNQLKEAGMPVITTRVGTVKIEETLSTNELNNEQQLVTLFAEQFFREELRWKVLVEAGEKGSILCEWILAKIRFPLLTILLILLLVNYYWQNQLRFRQTKQQTELNRLETDRKLQEKLSKETETLLDEFHHNNNTAYTQLFDKIALCIPEELLLEKMVANPLMKSIEEKKAIILQEKCIEITGTTIIPEKVSLLTTQLARLPEIQEVKLISIDQKREKAWFYFHIQIKL